MATAPLGGINSVTDFTESAFTNHLPDFDEATIADFDLGDEGFEAEFVTTTDATLSENLPNDGLGPLFNAVSCEKCHVEDGRGRPPELGETQTGFLVRVALDEFGADGHTLGDAIYGGQFQDMAIDGVASEGRVSITYTERAGTFPDGTPYSLREPVYDLVDLRYGDLAEGVTLSPRIANQMIGLGLLEAIPAETILGLADADDRDGDGISGRPNLVYDVQSGEVVLGRFGWKASHPNLRQQSAGAYNGDMGITTSLFPVENCTNAQFSGCVNLLSGGAPELADEHLDLVTLYVRSLAVPAQRDVTDEQVIHGESLFEAAQCSACHVPSLQTGAHEIAQLANQNIRPYTDMLLHDMGAGLADGQLDYAASGQEWRTPPLWGIGLFETVNGYAFYLHDGRARDLTEAILWHDGEAANARDTFMNMSAEDRSALLAFLHSL